VGVGSEEFLGDAHLVISDFKGLTPQKLLQLLEN